MTAVEATTGSGLRGRSFVALLATTIATFAGYGLVLPVIPLWAVHGGAGTAAAGTTTGVLMAATVISQLVVPRLLHSFGHRAVLIVGCALLGGTGLAFVASDQLPVILTVAAIRGIGFGLLTVCGSAIVAELLPARLRGRGTGMYGVAVGLPQLAFLPAGVWLVDRVGFGPVILAGGVASLVGALLAFGIRRSDLHPETPEATEPTSPARTPAVLASLAGPFTVLLVAAIGTGALQTFAPLALAEPGWAPVALLAVTSSSVLSRWLAGVVGDRLDRPALLVPSVGLAAAGVVGLAYAGVAGSGTAGILTGIVGATLLGFGAGALQNHTLVLMFGRVSRRHYGTASMAWNISLDAGTGVGAVLLGVAADGLGFPWAFTMLAVLILLTGPIAFRARRESAHPPQPPPVCPTT